MLLCFFKCSVVPVDRSGSPHVSLNLEFLASLCSTHRSELQTETLFCYFPSFLSRGIDVNKAVLHIQVF